jgi:hypothetical protein
MVIKCVYPFPDHPDFYMLKGNDSVTQALMIHAALLGWHVIKPNRNP